MIFHYIFKQIRAHTFWLCNRSVLDSRLVAVVLFALLLRLRLGFAHHDETFILKLLDLLFLEYPHLLLLLFGGWLLLLLSCAFVRLSLFLGSIGFFLCSSISAVVSASSITSFLSSVLFALSQLSFVGGPITFATLAECLLSSLWSIFGLFWSFFAGILLGLLISWLCLWFSGDWSRWRRLSIFWLDLVVDEDDDFRDFAIVYFLYDFYLIDLALLIQDILFHNYDFVCVSESCGDLLLDWFFSMLSH